MFEFGDAVEDVHAVGFAAVVEGGLGDFAGDNRANAAVHVFADRATGGIGVLARPLISRVWRIHRPPFGETFILPRFFTLLVFAENLDRHFVGRQFAVDGVPCRETHPFALVADQIVNLLWRQRLGNHVPVMGVKPELGVGALAQGLPFPAQFFRAPDLAKVLVHFRHPPEHGIHAGLVAVEQELRVARVNAAMVADAIMRVGEIPFVGGERAFDKAVFAAPAQRIGGHVMQRLLKPRKLPRHPAIVAGGLPSVPDALGEHILGVGQHRHPPHDEICAVVVFEPAGAKRLAEPGWRGRVGIWVDAIPEHPVWQLRVEPVIHAAGHIARKIFGSLERVNMVATPADQQPVKAPVDEIWLGFLCGADQPLQPGKQPGIRPAIAGQPRFRFKDKLRPSDLLACRVKRRHGVMTRCAARLEAHWTAGLNRTVKVRTERAVCYLNAGDLLGFNPDRPVFQRRPQAGTRVLFLECDVEGHGGRNHGFCREWPYFL